MKRFDCRYDGMEEHTSGDYVLFTDHEAAINYLERIIEEQRKANDELNAECMRLGSLEVDVEAAIQQAVAAEREECAIVAENYISTDDNNQDKWTVSRTLQAFRCAAAIRQRGDVGIHPS